MSDDIMSEPLDGEESASPYEGLGEVAERLTHSRPVPRAAMRGYLRAFLAAADASGLLTSRPRRLWLWVAACAVAGAVLLAVVAVGIAGSGPFAP